MSKILLNLGCGGTRPEGWVNIDSSFNAFLQTLPMGKWVANTLFKSTMYESNNVTYMDLNKKHWHYSANSVDVVYASHFLEHLSKSAALFLIQEAYKALKPNGIIRIVVPDLYQNAKNYISAVEEGNKDASNAFLYILDLHKEQAYPSNRGWLSRFVNWYQDYPHQHKYMYDKDSLSNMLIANGFREVKESEYGKSNYIPNITDVEYTSEGVAAIYIEALK